MIKEMRDKTKSVGGHDEKSVEDCYRRNGGGEKEKGME